jgi:hypothetical protein
MIFNSKMAFTLIFVLFLTLLAFEFSGIGEAQSDYNLKYDLNKNDQLIYNCTYFTEKSESTIPIQIKILISDFDGNNITSKVTSIKTTDGNTTESSYVTITDIYGNLVRTYPENRIIPEVQPELPNLLTYSEKRIKKGDSWSTTFRKNIGNASSSDENTEGTKNYTCIGLRTISLDAGEFECIGIKSETNFVSTTKEEVKNATIYFTTSGKISGEDWVNINDGLLVKSEYSINRVTTTDLSELYQTMGLENVYTDYSISSHMTNELVV